MTLIKGAPDSQQPFVDTRGFITSAWFHWLLNIVGAATTGGTVTHTGTLTAPKLIQGNGGADIIVNTTTATVTKLTAGVPSAATAGTDYVAPGAITSDGITMSTARLLGRTTAATGAVEEITAGTGLSLSAGTLTATNAGTVTHSAGNLTAGQLVYGNGAADLKTTAATDGQIPIGKTSDGTAALSTLTAGSGVTITNAANSVTIASAGGGVGTALPSTCEGRLTLQSGVPVPVTDLTAQSTIYFTPSTATGDAITTGNVTLYTGASLVNVALTQLSLALSSLTSGKNYDVFVDYNSGSPQLVLSAAWTTDTTRADALGVQTGLIIKSGTPAYRWVGTLRTTGTTTTEDSGGGTTTQVGGKRYLWNAYNQVTRYLAVIDTTDSWNYTTNTIRQANGASGNKVEWVAGSASVPVAAMVIANIDVASNSSVAAKAGVGLDSTSTFGGPLVGMAFNGGAAQVILPIVSFYNGYPGLGYHFLSWNEKGANGVTSTFTGDDGGDSSQSGLRADLQG